jgi:hypothetical protein
VAPTGQDAILEMPGGTKGFLPAWGTTAQRDAIVSPRDGLTFYNTETHALEHFSSGSASWESVDGVQSINGMTAKAQVLNTGSDGVAPAFAQSGGNTNTLNIPMASTAGVSAGLLSKNEYDSLDSRQYPVQNVKYVNLNPTPGVQGFNSVQDAIDSILDASASNPYLVKVGPGVYAEDQLEMKSWVWVEGSEQDQTVIEALTPNEHVVIGADNSGISKCLLRGATDPGFAAVYYQSLTGTTNTSFFVEDVRFGSCDHLVISDASFAATAVFMENCKLGGTHQFNHGFLAQNGGRVILRNSTTTGLTAPYPDFVYKATGAGSEIVMNGVQTRSGTLTGEACIHLADGGKLRALSTNLKGFGKAIWIENSGDGSIVDAVGVLLEDNTMDIQVDHPDADGTFNGSADHTKIFIDPASTFSVVASCNKLPSDNTGFITVGSILQGDRYDRLLNLSLMVREDSTLGVIDGGAMSTPSGLLVDVAAGSGFLIEPSLLFVKEVEWDATQLTIPANSVRYIYVDTNGVVQQSPSLLSLTTIIQLGKVSTGSSLVRYIEGTEMDMAHVGNKVEGYLRALGPVFGQGGMVSESGTRNLDVTAGIYFYGVNSLSLAGGSAITWTAVYRDGLGGWSELSQSTVSNTQYDDGSGTLVSIPSGEYAAHTVYVIGDDTNEVYFLVYSQDIYPTLADAEAAPLPLVPPFISDAVVRIASVIVQEGVSSLSNILDLRPRIGFAAPATAGTTDHGSLLGLLNDDHPQYLLVSGARAMAGPLNMGAQDITNVGNVDGVDVSDHQGRHLPNGSDPLTTAAPIANLGATTTNAVGTANSLSRSDHSHAIDTAVAVTQLPDQSNAAGSSASLSRADHVHAIPTAAPTTSLSASTSNSQGVAATFGRSDHTHAILTGTPVSVGTANASGSSANLARADHVHAHGAQTDPAQHAVVTTSVNGFMSAADKTKLDGIAAGAQVNTTVRQLFLSASAWTPVASAPAQPGSRAMPTNGLNVFYYGFATGESVDITIPLPQDWNLGTITFKPYWTSAASTGTVIFSLAGVAVSHDDLLTAAFGTAQTSTTTKTATNDCQIGPASSAITIAGTPADADLLCLRLSRSGGTLGADAQLLGIVVQYTATGNNPSTI